MCRTKCGSRSRPLAARDSNKYRISTPHRPSTVLNTFTDRAHTNLNVATWKDSRMPAESSGDRGGHAALTARRAPHRFTFRAPWALPSLSPTADTDASSVISDYESAHSDVDDEIEPVPDKEASEPIEDANSFDLPSLTPLTASRRRRLSSSSGRVVKRARHRSPPSTPTRARPPAPSRSGLACPSPRCGNQPMKFIGDHIRTTHTGPLALSDDQLRSVGYIRCEPCSGCFRITATGQPWHHTCSTTPTTPRTGRPRTITARPPAEPIALPTGPVTPAPDTVSRYHQLALLPAHRGLLPAHTVSEWKLLCERLAASYIANPTSEEALYNILAAPKVALSPWRDPTVSLLKRIISYPSVTPIQPRPVPDGTSPPPPLNRRVRRFLQRQQLRRAASLLRGPSKVVPATPQVLEQLRAKFPARTGPTFAADGPAPRACDFDEDSLPIMDCFRSFSADVSGGVSGWSQPLLSLALKNETFLRFIKLLTRQLVAGTAPGRDMLTTSLLTPLAKADGGVRPIACPDLIYRLCAKVILAAAPLDGALLPCQLGLGSAGGVEPIVLLAQQVAEGKVDGLTHVASVDLKNAYGSLHRGPLARATRTHVGSLYRLAKLRYEHAGTMVIASNGEIHVLHASDGVYQGDPLAGLLFCVGVRPVLEQLLEFLKAREFNVHILCYLDDWTIFADRGGILEAVREFFDELRANDAHRGLELNLNKSWERSGEQLLETGQELLGSMIGGAEARRAFLLRKIGEQTASLQHLEQLHKQDAQLLLRRSLQLQLRHLQRLLPSEGLDDIWTLLDDAHHHSLRLLRDGAARPRRGAHDSTLFQLPLRLGGLGVPNHQLVAPHARAAMEQSASRLLREVLPSLWPDHVLASDGDDAQLTSQAQRVAVEYKRLDDTMMAKLSMEEAQTVVANGDRIASACLQTFPIDARTTLSDRQVQVNLHNRTLLRAVAPLCPDCTLPNSHGHDDDCGDRPHRRTVRHDNSKNLFVAALRHVKGVRVNAEPRIEEQSMRRTDWRVHGSAAAGGGGDTDYDITFVSLTNTSAQRAPGRSDHMLLVNSVGMRAAATKRMHDYLDAKAKHKSQYYNGAVPTSFVPLVFSLEGAAHAQAKATLKQWRSLIPSFSYLVSCVSVVLARTRAETFYLV